jgi:hypothetical protein
LLLTVALLRITLNEWLRSMFRNAESCMQEASLWAGEHMHRGKGAILLRFASNQREHPSVRVELLRLLYGYAPAVLVANAVNGALIVFVFWGVVARHLLIVWSWPPSWRGRGCGVAIDASQEPPTRSLAGGSSRPSGRA